MRLFLHLLFTLTLYSYGIAQNCPHLTKYREKIQAADSLIAAGNFSLAYENYSAAQIYCRDSTEVIEEAKAALFQRINKLREEAETAKQEAVEAKAQTQAALGKANKLIDAFYFYANRFALAYVEKDFKEFFYFIDKNGDEVKKLGQWEKAEQFDDSGFAKVVDDKSVNYLMDTTGQTYRVAYRLEDLYAAITALDLRKLPFDAFPKAVLKHPQLEVLLLDGEHRKENNFTSLPAGIKSLFRLRVLSLGYCQIQSLPSEIGQLNNLTSLNLYENQLTSLPPEIGQLNNLTTLELRINDLTSLPPEISQLSNLTELYLGDFIFGGNQLTNLPPEITQLTNLAELYLEGNQLTSLPPQIGQLTNLSSLELQDNQLTSLPPEIGQLTNLTSLELQDNQLTSLPPEITQLTNLKYLYLSGNNFSPAERTRIRQLLPNCKIEF